MQIQERAISRLVRLLSVLVPLLFPITARTQSTQTQLSVPSSRIPSGLIFLDDATYASIPEASSPLMGVLPPSKDLTAQFPPPGDQGKFQNSCAAWAVAYALKTYQEGVERRWPINRNDHIFSPSFLYNSLNADPTCQAGLSFLQVLNYLHASGVATLQDFPYDPQSCADVPNPSVKMNAQPFAIGSWRKVNVQDDTEMKSQIASGIPILAGVFVDDEFYTLYRGPQGKGVFNNFDSAKKIGQHAFVIIGYDDAKQAYEIVNSWGPSWGNGGYGWIAYDTFHRMVKEGFVMQDDLSHTYGFSGPAASPAQNPPIPNPASVHLEIPILMMNSQVRNALGVFPGITIAVPGQMSNGVGHHLQLVARFFVNPGQMIPANAFEQTYRDASGLVAVGTSPLTITAPLVELGPLNFSIPYYALNQGGPTNGQLQHQVSVVVSAYIDSFLVSETLPETFTYLY